MSPDEAPDNVVVEPVSPGDELAFDILRWTKEGNEAVPDARTLVEQVYRRVEPEDTSGTLGRYLCAESEDDAEHIAMGETASHHWIASRFQLPVRMGAEPWISLRRRAHEVQQIMFTEMIDAARWAYWRRGQLVREVEFGLRDNPIVRGAHQGFEKPHWNGKKPSPEPEPEFRPVSPEDRIDIEALIASEPPEHLEVLDGTRYLMTRKPEWINNEGSYRYGYGSFEASWIDGDHVFINLDTLNLDAFIDDGDEWPSLDELVPAALAEWFGLSARMPEWEWPCGTLRVLRK